MPVRRACNLVEEFTEKSVARTVFEPNATPLRAKVEGMIEAYLIQMWRKGAQQGSTPGAGPFVKVDLGETVTPEGSLDGRSIGELGMAVGRPTSLARHPKSRWALTIGVPVSPALPILEHPMRSRRPRASGGA